MTMSELPKKQQFNIGAIIALFHRRRWTKWELIYIYHFSITNRSIEVRQNLYDGRLQFRVRKIAEPVYGKHFDVEDVKRALAK